MDPDRLLMRARRIAETLSHARAVLMVGGCVRDKLLGLPVKDIDLEVYGLEYEEIASALQAAGMRTDLVGRQFAVIKVDQSIDVAIPRHEIKSGCGHRGFAVEPDPDMDFAAAARRRDFTINAMAEDFNGQLIDPYGGAADLRAGLLRAVSPAFAEDPLRVLRGMQFAARFNLTMEDATAAMCRSLLAEFPTLPLERVWTEWQKWAIAGDFPSMGLQVLSDTGWVQCFPELAAMQGVPQDPVWHPEGDVWVHTLHVCDAAAAIARREQLPREARTVLLLSALAHDMGKAITTHRSEEGRWVAPKHDRAGVPLAEAFLARIGAPLALRAAVAPLVAEHMSHISIEPSDLSARAVRRLSNRLHPATLRQLSYVVEADHGGRPPLPGGRPLDPWLQLAEQLATADQRPRPILFGRHLLPHGIAPGPAMGALLAEAFEAQLDGAFTDLPGAEQWLLRRLRKP